MKLSTLSVIAALLLLPLSNASAVEVLSAKELSSHCKFYAKDSASADGEFCARYIQGFIDGAIATDARVMLNIEADLTDRPGFVERAMRTRAPNRAEYNRAARYAEFCLGDPVPLKEVVTHIVNDLETGGSNIEQALTARDVVYASLKTHYPCKTE